MSFRQMSAALMLGLLTVASMAYGAVVAIRLTEMPADEFGYERLLFGVIAWVVLLGALGHLILAARADDRDRVDERDRALATRGERVAGVIVTAAALVALGLAMADASSFWVAHAIIVGLVAAEMTKSSLLLVLYRRDAW